MIEVALVRDGIPADPTTAYSRAVEIKLNGDPVNSAEIDWEWETPLYCPSTGDADRLPIGTTLVTATQLGSISMNWIQQAKYCFAG